MFLVSTWAAVCGLQGHLCIELLDDSCGSSCATCTRIPHPTAVLGGVLAHGRCTGGGPLAPAEPTRATLFLQCHSAGCCLGGNCCHPRAGCVLRLSARACGRKRGGGTEGETGPCHPGLPPECPPILGPYRAATAQVAPTSLQ